MSTVFLMKRIDSVNCQMSMSRENGYNIEFSITKGRLLSILKSVILNSVLELINLKHRRNPKHQN